MNSGVCSCLFLYRNSVCSIMRTLLLCTAMRSTLLYRTWLDPELRPQLLPGSEAMMLFKYAVIFFILLFVLLGIYSYIYIKTFFKMREDRCVFYNFFNKSYNSWGHWQPWDGHHHISPFLSYSSLIPCLWNHFCSFLFRFLTFLKWRSG